MATACDPQARFLTEVCKGSIHGTIDNDVVLVRQAAAIPPTAGYSWGCRLLDNRPMPMPKATTGDLLIRPVKGGRFELVELASQKHVGAGVFETIAAAVSAARALNPQAIWQQNIDDRGRPLGDPFRIPDFVQRTRDLDAPDGSAVKGGIKWK